MENSMELPQNTKIELPYDPAISLLGIYPEKTIIQRESQCSQQQYLQYPRHGNNLSVHRQIDG